MSSQGGQNRQNGYKLGTDNTQRIRRSKLKHRFDQHFSLVGLSRRLSNLPQSLHRALSNKVLLTSKFRDRSSDSGQSLNGEISSFAAAISLRKNTQLTPLDKAEIGARAWQGQSSAELAAMFDVTAQTISRVVREANSNKLPTNTEGAADTD
jgi:DNA-directed RNA polymerase specialized sigma24 family protein